MATKRTLLDPMSMIPTGPKRLRPPWRDAERIASLRQPQLRTALPQRLAAAG